MSKLDRKKKRNEERQTTTVKSFKDFGQTTMVREIKTMDEKKQRQILSKLDDEAADVFKGLLRITDKAAETHAPVDDLFDSVRAVMQFVRLKDYREAYREVKNLVGMPNALFKVRSILVRVGHDLAALARHQMGSALLEPHESEAKLVERINHALSEVTAFGANDESTIEAEDFDIIGEITVDLPSEIERPTLVEGVTLLVLPDRKLRTSLEEGVRELASGTYLIEAMLIGIPTDVPAEDREAMAQAFAMKKLQASISPLAMVRPDSDAVWYPLFKQRFAAEIVHFPDQARRYYGTSSAMSVQQAAQNEAKALRLKAVRAEFENKNAEVLEELNEAKAAWDEASLVAKELSDKFLTDTNFSWSTKFATIEAHYRREHELDLELVGDNFAKRWNLNKAFASKIEEFRARHDKIVATRAIARAAFDRITAINKEVAERKSDTLNPFRGTAKRIARMGKKQSA